MASNVCFHCENCINRCASIPIPIDYLAKAAAHNNSEIQEKSYSLYTGKIVVCVCALEKRFVFSKFI